MKKIKSDRNQISINKYLPHNFLAEKIILSCLLRNSEAIELTICTLPVEAFYFKNHQSIYRVIRFLYKNKVSIDIVTLLTFLQDNGLLQQVGGVKVLIELITQLPNLIYLEEYLALIKDKYIRRSLIKLGYEVINSSYITNISLEEILNEFETKLFSITTTMKTQESIPNLDLLNKIFFDLKTKSLNPSLNGIASGFDNLDALTQGFQNSDLIIIAGRPSMGKTAFALNITSNIIKNLKLPILFFSLEMSKEQIMYRLLAMESNINQMNLKSGKLNQDDWFRLTKLIKIFSKLPLFIDDTFNLSIQDIRSKIKSIILEHDQIGLVIIDYIQLMQNSKLKSENRVQELTQITRALKMLAREFNIPIIALSQLSRSVETRIDKKPILSDLRESGSIEQDADLVMFLYKNQSIANSINHDFKKNNFPNEFIDLIQLIIAKHRNGPVGKIDLKFNTTRTKFSDKDLRKSPEPDSNR